MKNTSGASLKTVCQWSQEKQRPVVIVERNKNSLFFSFPKMIITFHAKTENVHIENARTKRLRF